MLDSSGHVKQDKARLPQGTDKYARVIHLFAHAREGNPPSRPKRVPKEPSLAGLVSLSLDVAADNNSWNVFLGESRRKKKYANALNRTFERVERMAHGP